MTDQATTNAQPEAAPAGLWAAFWPLLAAACSFLAAIAAFTYQGRSVLLDGGLAVAAGSVGMLFSRWQAAQRRGEQSLLARIPLGALVCFGFAVCLAAYALLVGTMLKNWRGVSLWGDLLLWKEGAMNMAMLLASVFAALGLAIHLLQSSVQWSGTTQAKVAAALALSAFLFGPTLNFEVRRGGGDIGQRELYFKYSLPEMLTRPDEVYLRAETVRSGDHEAQTIVCAGQYRMSILMFGKQSAWAEISREEYYEDESKFQQKVTQCEAENNDALESGRAIEGALYTGQLARFFGRVRAAPQIYRQHAMAADISRLPEPLKSTLTSLLPKAYRWNYTAFDVALAIGDKAAAIAAMPKPEDVLPHQRQTLFNMGLVGLLDGVAAETSDTIAAKRQETYRSQVNMAIRLGSPDLLKNAMMFAPTRGNGYGDFRGGVSEFDYYMANRHCDLAYAKFLGSRKIQPTTQHVVHLLSVIGHAQYPDAHPTLGGRSDRFAYADNSLGLPDEEQLGQCVALAAHYAATVQDFNDEHPELADARSLTYRQRSAYDVVYGIAREAVFEWVIRANERKRNDGEARDLPVVGDPALLVNAAVEVLRVQPASFEQYCAWANTANIWLTLVKEEQPSMVAAMIAIPEQWRRAKVVFRSPSASCNLDGLFWITSEFDTAEQAMKFLNPALKQVGIPCQGRHFPTEHRQELSCGVKTAAWPARTPAATASE